MGKTSSFAMNIAASMRLVDSLKVPGLSVDSTHVTIFAAWPLLQSQIWLAPSISASVIVGARDRNARTFVTPVSTDSSRLSVASTTARHPIAKLNAKGDATAATTHVKWWRAGIARHTNNALKSAAREGDCPLEEQRTPCAKTSSTDSVQAPMTDEGVVDELRRAIDTANTISARFAAVKIQRLRPSSSALVTSVLCQNVIGSGKRRSTDFRVAILMDYSARATVAVKRAVITRLP
ncbi:hypothetical protein FDECE_9024 [Fusarium decemcellulare]|nr:hypothetical protein FDECE_9024 [Fusarium decemcellulare]